MWWKSFWPRGFDLCPLVRLLEGSSESVLLGWSMTSPVFGLRRPEGSSDEVIVAELEREASDIYEAIIKENKIDK